MRYIWDTLSLSYILAAGTAAALAIKLGPSQAEPKLLDMQSTSTVRPKTQESKGGHLSRVGTRGPVSRRKCSANHRLSTDHRLRSTTSWAINSSPGWTSSTSILQGREDTGQASLPHGTHQASHIISITQFFCTSKNLTMQEAPMACFTSYFFLPSFCLSDNKKLIYFWLEGDN